METQTEPDIDLDQEITRESHESETFHGFVRHFVIYLLLSIFGFITSFHILKAKTARSRHIYIGSAGDDTSLTSPLVASRRTDPTRPTHNDTYATEPATSRMETRSMAFFVTAGSFAASVGLLVSYAALLLAMSLNLYSTKETAHSSIINTMSIAEMSDTTLVLVWTCFILGIPYALLYSELDANTFGLFTRIKETLKTFILMYAFGAIIASLWRVLIMDHIDWSLFGVSESVYFDLVIIVRLLGFSLLGYAIPKGFNITKKELLEVYKAAQTHGTSTTTQPRSRRPSESSTDNELNLQVLKRIGYEINHLQSRLKKTPKHQKHLLLEQVANLEQEQQRLANQIGCERVNTLPFDYLSLPFVIKFALTSFLFIATLFSIVSLILFPFRPVTTVIPLHELFLHIGHSYIAYKGLRHIQFRSKSVARSFLLRALVVTTIALVWRDYLELIGVDLTAHEHVSRGGGITILRILLGCGMIVFGVR